MEKNVKIESFIDKKLKTRALNKGDYCIVHHFPNINPVKRSVAEAPALQEKLSYNPFNSSKGFMLNNEKKDHFHLESDFIGSFLVDKGERNSFIDKKELKNDIKDKFALQKNEPSFFKPDKENKPPLKQINLSKSSIDPLLEKIDPLLDPLDPVFGDLENQLDLFPLQRASTGSFIFYKKGENEILTSFNTKNDEKEEVLKLRKENGELKEMFLIKEKDYLKRIEGISKEVVAVKAEYKALEVKIEFILKEKDDLIEKLQRENNSKSYKGKENTLIEDFKEGKPSINMKQELPNEPKKPLLLIKRQKNDTYLIKTPLNEKKPLLFDNKGEKILKTQQTHFSTAENSFISKENPKINPQNPFVNKSP